MENGEAVRWPGDCASEHEVMAVGAGRHFVQIRQPPERIASCAGVHLTQCCWVQSLDRLAEQPAQIEGRPCIENAADAGIGPLVDSHRLMWIMLTQTIATASSVGLLSLATSCSGGGRTFLNPDRRQYIWRGLQRELPVCDKPSRSGRDYGC